MPNAQRSEVAEKKIKGKIDGYFGLARVGRLPKAKVVAATACTEKPCSTQGEIKDSSSQCNKKNKSSQTGQPQKIFIV